MDKYIKYASYIDANFMTNIQGASETEILDFEQAVGYNFPKIYREFLLKLGHTEKPTLGLLGGFATIDISELTEYNLELIDLCSGLSPNSVLFAFGDEPGMESINIGLYFKPDDDPKVYMMSCGKLTELVADSFYKYLFQSIFSRSGDYYPNLTLLKGKMKKNLIEKSKKVSMAFDFEIQWFSDSVNFFGIRKDNSAIIKVNQHDPLNFYMKIHYQYYSDIADIIEALSKIGINYVDRVKGNINMSLKIPKSQPL